MVFSPWSCLCLGRRPRAGAIRYSPALRTPVNFSLPGPVSPVVAFRDFRVLCRPPGASSGAHPRRPAAGISRSRLESLTVSLCRSHRDLISLRNSPEKDRRWVPGLAVCTAVWWRSPGCLPAGNPASASSRSMRTREWGSALRGPTYLRMKARELDLLFHLVLDLPALIPHDHLTPELLAPWHTRFTCPSAGWEPTRCEGEVHEVISYPETYWKGRGYRQLGGFWPG